MHKAFRGDIQGLRALAVLLVVLDHAHVGLFQGGFVGVDVFFVISGFLITSLLVAEAAREQTISLSAFYARRARRILPAATVVTLVTVVASVFFLSGVEARSAIGDAVWVTFFAANFKFASDGTDYFNAEAAPSPLQHYWSLAVEEQFYLVWPLLILVLCLVMRWRGSRRKQAGVAGVAVPVLVLVVVASFAWSVAYTGQNSIAAYFSPFTRAWELGIGALAACLAPQLARAPRALLALLSWAGLAAVAVAALAFDSDTPFPGYAAALPVVGATLLLVGGLHPAGWGPQRILSVLPMRVVGDWSYSFYLWHWPALVIAGSLWGTPSGWYGVAVLAVALGLSGLSYHLVENPFRRARRTSVRPLRGVLLYPAVVVLTLPLLAGAQQVVEHAAEGGGPPITTARYGQQPADPKPHFRKDPAIALVQASVLAAKNDMEVPRDLEPSPLELDAKKPETGACEYFTINQNRPLCPFGDLDADRNLVLVGDSHARQWIPALDVLAERHGYTAYYLVRLGCPGSDVTPWLSDGSGPSIDCQDFQDWAAEQVAELKPAVTLVGSGANPQGFADDDGNWVTDEEEMAQLFETGMEREITRLAPYSGRVIVIGDPPATEFQGALCLSRRDASLQNCLADRDPRSSTMIAALREAAVRTDTQYVDTAAWFCVKDACPSVVGHYVTRRDLQHVTVEYAAHLTGALGAQLRLGS